MAEENVTPSGGFDDGLPLPGVARWSPKRKATIVQAVRSGALSIKEACRRYSLSEAELADWLNRYAVEGRRGLSVTKR
jgi:transposase-like protein